MKFLRTVLAVIVGLFIGGTVNSALVAISGKVIPLPAGVNPNDIQSIISHISEYQPKHFIMPFLAHALGTFTAGFIIAVLTHKEKKVLWWIPGLLFFVGGGIAIVMIPAPLWFNALDLLVAYFPMAYFGNWLGLKLKGLK
jgi:hypothetical protein